MKVLRYKKWDTKKEKNRWRTKCHERTLLKAFVAKKPRKRKKKEEK
jgi:hypothetical protein